MIQGLPFTVVPSDFKENLDKTHYQSPSHYVRETASRKANSMLQHINDPSFPPSNKKKWLILSADTIVVMDNVILEKPKDKQEAIKMLNLLSGRKHCVITSVIYFFINVRGDQCEVKEESFVEETTVEFIVLDDEMIQKYVETGEPM